MGAVGLGDALVGGAGFAADGGTRHEQEDALQVVGDALRQFERHGPGFAAGGLLVDTRAGDRHAAAEFAHGHRRTRHAPHAGAHQELLIENRIGAVGRLRIGKDLGEDMGQLLLAFLQGHFRRRRPAFAGTGRTARGGGGL